jgi:hypothetical protein
MKPTDREPAVLLEKNPAKWCPTCCGTGGPRYRGEWMHCTDCHGTGATRHHRNRYGLEHCDAMGR